MTSHIIETDGLTRTFRVREGVRRISGDRSADAVQGVAEEAAKKARE